MSDAPEGASRRDLKRLSRAGKRLDLGVRFRMVTLSPPYKIRQLLAGRFRHFGWALRQNADVNRLRNEGSPRRMPRGMRFCDQRHVLASVGGIYLGKNRNIHGPSAHAAPGKISTSCPSRPGTTDKREQITAMQDRCQ